MSRKKVSTTIYITPEQADHLKLLHDRTKVPIAVYIREGIDMVLKHYTHMLPGQMSLEVQRTLSQGVGQSVGQQGTLDTIREPIDSVPPPPPPPKR
jgi:predicted DNA-binding protein